MAHTCPSARCGDGALLLGVMTTSGRLAYLGSPVEVDAGFVETEILKGTPEQRFRFASSCAEAGCQQWLNERCSVGDAVASLTSERLPTDQLPRCGIRASCRWFEQSGAAACSSCALVVADQSGSRNR